MWGQHKAKFQWMSSSLPCQEHDNIAQVLFESK